MTLQESFSKILRALLTVHLPKGRRSIVILSAPRSGSTWLLEILAALPGLKPIREPMNLRRPEVPQMLGLAQWKECYAESNRDKVISYLQAFAHDNRYSFKFKREKPFTATWHPFTDRVIYKILHGCEHMIDDLINALDADVVFLVRHPVAVALSRKHLPRLEAFISSDFAKQFTPAQISEALRINNEGSFLQRATVDWCLQNALPLKCGKERCLTVTYEELTLNPTEVLKVICNRLGLALNPALLAQIDRPSGSSAKSEQQSQAMLNNIGALSDRRQLIEKWRGRISENEEQEIFRILDVFGIDAYRFGDFYPDPKYLILNNA